MKRIQPTYAAYTKEDMDALYGTRPATSTLQTVECPDGYMPYTIAAGDTLRSIAAARGITVTELLFYNPSLNPYGYKRGDVICVPDSVPDQPDEGAVETPSQPSEGETPAQPGEGTVEAPTPSLPSEEETPAQPGEGTVETPTPSLPSEEETPAQPGEGSAEPSTPSMPSEGETPAQPGEGSAEVPTPSLPSTPSRPATPSCENGVLYTVRSGDTLRLIAQRFDVTLDALMSANPGQTNSRLIIGQRLCIPQTTCSACCPAGSTAIRIRSTDFVDYLITYNISYAALSAVNPGLDLDHLTVGRQICIPPIGSRGSCAEGVGTQELPQDLTAATLAEQLNVTVADLMRYNPTFTPTDFRRGRIICVPPRT